MEDYTNTQQYKTAKVLGKALKFLVFMRILGALFILSSLFFFIWLDFAFAMRMFLTAFLFAAIMFTFYNMIQKQLKKIHGSK